MKAHLILGNQLFSKHPAKFSNKNEPKILIESIKNSSRYSYHKLKLVFVFSSMRHYAEELRSEGHKVIYIEQSSKSLNEELKNIILENRIDLISYMKPVDRNPQIQLTRLFLKENIQTEVLPSMLHITDQEYFSDWFKKSSKPIMENFYRQQRINLNILMDGEKPIGGEWNYDKENRKPLPKDLNEFPELIKFEVDEITKKVINDVEKNFKKNPGNITNIWFPTNTMQARELLKDFIDKRLFNFGKYEDAIRQKEPFLFHSALSAVMNNGLLEVHEVLQAVLENKSIPISSSEGFIRQIIGWREYMFGLYNNMPELENANYFGFKKELEDYWFTLDFEDRNLPEAIKNSLKTLKDFSYNHHIERLMVLGNWFLINEYNPQSVNKWFLSMYIDAYEWVMLPNVVGMSQYADGGKVATKPYISGDAYLKKMGNFTPSINPEDRYTEKYWNFLKNNYDKLKNNPRIGLALSNAKKRV